MKQVIFATSNPSKVKRFADGLLNEGIQLLCLKDLDLKLDIEENGQTAIENALIKARACYKLTHKSVIGMDDTLYMEGVPLERQPGLFVRRINGKTLNDEELLKHYISIVKEYGVDGKVDCKWIYGLAVINENGEESVYTWFKDNFYMVDVPSEIKHPGYPLNSISKYKVIEKYFTEVSEDDKRCISVDESDVIQFIVDHMQQLIRLNIYK